MAGWPNVDAYILAMDSFLHCKAGSVEEHQEGTSLNCRIPCHPLDFEVISVQTSKRTLIIGGIVCGTGSGNEKYEACRDLLEIKREWLHIS